MSVCQRAGISMLSNRVLLRVLCLQALLHEVFVAGFGLANREIFLAKDGSEGLVHARRDTDVGIEGLHVVHEFVECHPSCSGVVYVQ